MRTGTARVAARGSRLCVATSAINSRTWSELSWGGKQADFARVCFCTRKRQQASEALDSARAKAGTVLNFIPAFSYFSTEAITCIVICDMCDMRDARHIHPQDGKSVMARHGETDAVSVPLFLLSNCVNITILLFYCYHIPLYRAISRI